MAALPTRDAVIVILSLLAMAKQEVKNVSAPTDALPARFIANNRHESLCRKRLGYPLRRFAFRRTYAAKAAPTIELRRKLRGITPKEIKEFPTETAKNCIAQLIGNNDALPFQVVDSTLEENGGKVENTDLTDGLRITFESGEIIHPHLSAMRQSFAVIMRQIACRGLKA